MRVVVHHPAREEEDGTQVEAAKSAYRVGRVEDHVDFLTGRTTPQAEVVKLLVEAAEAEFPGQEVTVEHLHVTERHEKTGEPIAHEWKDEPPEEQVPAGEVHEQVLAAEQGQEAAS